MKKNLICTMCMVLLTGFAFAGNKVDKVIKTIESSDFVCMDAAEAREEGKPCFSVVVQKKDDFIKQNSGLLNPEVLQGDKNISYGAIKDAFKTCDDGIYINDDGSISKYSWKDYKNFGCSICYEQKPCGVPLDGAGTYVVRIFSSDKVYTLSLMDCTNPVEKTDDYNCIGDLVYFNEVKEVAKATETAAIETEEKAEEETGETENALAEASVTTEETPAAAEVALSSETKEDEKTQGYYWKDDSSMDGFYERLCSLDEKLPASALNLQMARIYIENLLEKI